MATYYLAVDIGASSGRHILGHLENGKMILEEVYRFENGMVKKDGELCWEFDRLFREILNGMKKCKEIGKTPVSMGVDTWGVDFVLLDKDDKVIGNTVGYRDHRTDGMDEEVYKIISLEDLYARTGIQKAIFNTIYQLMAVKQQHPDYLEKVIEARELLASHEAATVTEAVKSVGISRNTFYRYKNYVFRMQEGGGDRKASISVNLKDRPGSLSSVIHCLSTANASIITISSIFCNS